MTMEKRIRVTIYWVVSTNSRERLYTIERLGLPSHMTVNGEAECIVTEDVYKNLLRAQSLNWLRLRNKKRTDRLKI